MFSEVISIIAAEVPAYIVDPVAVQILEFTSRVQISWTAPSNGFASIDQYEVQILDGSNANWVTVSSCSTSSVSTNTCEVDMLDLWNSPYSLAYGSLIQARVRAHNSYGWASSYSDVNTEGATVTSIPQQMSAPTVVSYSTSSITITWSAITTAPANGNSAITGYQLYWNTGVANSEPTTLLADTLLTTFTITGESITEGATYKFVIRAKNIYGSASSLSTPVLSVSAVSLPGKAPTASVAVDATNVVITWSDSTQSNGAAIDAYEVSFRTLAGIFVVDTSICNPVSGSTQFTTRTCTVPMSTLRTLTSLPVNSLIRVRVRAHNSEGYGIYSDVNTSGALIETLPLALSGLTQDISQLTNTQLYLQWSAPSTGKTRGGSTVTVTGYAVYWKQTPAAATWTLI